MSCDVTVSRAMEHDREQDDDPLRPRRADRVVGSLLSGRRCRLCQPRQVREAVEMIGLCASQNENT